MPMHASSSQGEGEKRLPERHVTQSLLVQGPSPEQATAPFDAYVNL